MKTEEFMVFDMPFHMKIFLKIFSLCLWSQYMVDVIDLGFSSQATTLYHGAQQQIIFAYKSIFVQIHFIAHLLKKQPFKKTHLTDS